MNSISITEISNEKTFQKPVYIDEQFLLLNAGIPFPSRLKSLILEWGFKEIFVDDNPAPQKTVEVKPVKLESFESVDIDDVLKTKAPIVVDSTNKVAVQMNREIIDIMNANSAMLKEIAESDLDGRLILVQKVYNGLSDYITKLYTRFVTHRELKIGLISEVVQCLCDFMKEYKKDVLRIQPQVNEKSDKNFIISHCLRSTIFAIVIGQNLKLPSTKLIDLGVASILHEIGQVRLPPQLYLTDRKLLPAERIQLYKHTIIGFNILKENNFPPPIQLGILEHHERENGKGYPRKVTGKQISLYGKILSVVCSYEAISAPRHYKEAKSTHEAMIEMLRNADKQYDDTIIKALLQSVSLFPIGGYVYLSNGKVAQVIDANAFDPRIPIVQILGEKNEFGFPLTVQTDNDKTKIVRVLNKNEITDILKALENK